MTDRPGSVRVRTSLAEAALVVAAVRYWRDAHLASPSLQVDPDDAEVQGLREAADNVEAAYRRALGRAGLILATDLEERRG